MRTELKLSDAIRLGAMLKPQIQDNFWRDGGTCALGAALDACGELKGDSDLELHLRVRALWPLVSVRVESPTDSGVVRPLLYQIADLNDVDGWTREQIADWVESIERQQEQPVTVHVTTERV